MKNVAINLGLLALLNSRASAANDVTFTRDVAPILWKNCAGCHHPGHVAPFPLLTYRDAARRAQFLAAVTPSRGGETPPPAAPPAGACRGGGPIRSMAPITSTSGA